MVQLLIVAPGRSLRNSLRFSLEADGYEVTAVAAVRDLDNPAAAFACTILDHHGLEGSAADRRATMQHFAPVVLLANRADHPMAPLSFCVLTKPFPGQALSDAVRAALEPRAGT